MKCSVAMVVRLARIGGIGAVLAYLFHLSRQAGIARGQEDLPGLLWAVGVVSVLFLVRAFVTEHTMGPDMTRQKDFLWGITLGGFATILLRLM